MTRPVTETDQAAILTSLRLFRASGIVQAGTRFELSLGIEIRSVSIEKLKSETPFEYAPIVGHRFLARSANDLVAVDIVTGDPQAFALITSGLVADRMVEALYNVPAGAERAVSIFRVSGLNAEALALGADRLVTLLGPRQIEALGGNFLAGCRAALEQGGGQLNNAAN